MIGQRATNLMWNWIADTFKKTIAHIRETQKAAKSFKHVYCVTVNVDHPRIIGHVVRFRVSIEANSKQHARKLCLQELKITIAEAIKVR